MQQVVWGQALWLPSFLVSALQVVPKNLGLDQAVIRETDSPPHYQEEPKTTSQRTGPQATRIRGKLEIHPLLHPFTMPCRKRDSQPSLQTLKPP